MVRYNKNNDFNNQSSSNLSQITLSSEPTDGNHAAAEIYVLSSSQNDKIDFKLRIKQILTTQTKVEISYNNGKQNVMIKLKEVNNNFYKNFNRKYSNREHRSIKGTSYRRLIHEETNILI